MHGTYNAYKGTKGAKETIIVWYKAATATVKNNGDTKVRFKNFVSFADCRYKVNNIQTDNAKEIDVVTLIHDLTLIGWAF